VGKSDVVLNFNSLPMSNNPHVIVFKRNGVANDFHTNPKQR
jgi:hypothetical protein